MIISKSSETINLASNSQNDTFCIGFALSSTLYQKCINLWFRGELGAGKTTFIQGLAKGLGLEEHMTSPTYAIENRYGEKFLHVDLYRLDAGEAKRIVEEGENFPGVRAIEWSERLEGVMLSSAARPSIRSSLPLGATRDDTAARIEARDIFITISELSESKRSIEVTFNDIPLPSRSDIETWRKEVRLPDHIIRHCDAVAGMSAKLGEELMKRGVALRPLALRRACELHDLLRFVDFKMSVQKKIPDAKEPDEETKKLWNDIQKRYPAEHEAACTEFLKEQGYPELGEIIRPHGLRSIVEEPETIKTIEQKLLYYADKRVRFETEVSIDERFDEFIERYGDGVESAWAKTARGRTKELERALFG